MSYESQHGSQTDDNSESTLSSLSQDRHRNIVSSNDELDERSTTASPIISKAAQKSKEDHSPKTRKPEEFSLERMIKRHEDIIEQQYEGKPNRIFEVGTDHTCQNNLTFDDDLPAHNTANTSSLRANSNPINDLTDRMMQLLLQTDETSRAMMETRQSDYRLIFESIALLDAKFSSSPRSDDNFIKWTEPSTGKPKLRRIGSVTKWHFYPLIDLSEDHKHRFPYYLKTVFCHRKAEIPYHSVGCVTNVQQCEFDPTDIPQAQLIYYRYRP